MTTARLIVLTVFGILALGLALAALEPLHWKYCELVLLAALLFFLRECLTVREVDILLRRIKDPPGGDPAWVRLQPQVRDLPQTTIGPPITRHQSVEQVAQTMVTHAFREASLKYHPDHGGDPEIMRRVYAARDMMMRGVRKV